MIQLCNSKTYRSVKLWNKGSMAFEVKTVLQQGDAISPIILNIALESAVQEMSNQDTWSLVFWIHR